jgi:hypothetical protein
MEGLEINWKERIGDFTFEKAEWKKNPSDRFKFMALSAVVNSNLFSVKQMDWVESNLFKIPEWEHLNPVALILGLASLENKEFSETKFQQSYRALSKFPKNVGVRSLDILRYAKAWEIWFKEKKLS